ncbi:hypothetical protein B0I35DRAFT_414458 [Stachybotrys elegans]|uniref:Uncharacterized protein n=1 Tax=Stachybotrys elegans TaxID=80388 RepID=A0A8K0SEP0_9HYPO|nr:hypothetical protein B0I35DRAFT_414458 [Stachybotrys elegans]
MPADNRRKLLQRRLNKLKQQQGQEALVEKVNEALAKDDQSLEAIPEQEWVAMNLDGPDEEERGDSAGVSSTSPAGSSHAESSGTAGENADAKASKSGETVGWTGRGTRNVPTKIFIAWQIGKDVKKSWETRQSLRIRWGVKEADELIFKAAQKAQDRFEDLSRKQQRDCTAAWREEKATLV